MMSLGADVAGTAVISQLESEGFPVSKLLGEGAYGWVFECICTRPARDSKLTEGEAPADIIDFANRLVSYVGDDGKLLVAIMQQLRQQERVVGILGVVNLR